VVEGGASSTRFFYQALSVTSDGRTYGGACFGDATIN